MCLISMSIDSISRTPGELFSTFILLTWQVPPKIANSNFIVLFTIINIALFTLGWICPRYKRTICPLLLFTLVILYMYWQIFSKRQLSEWACDCWSALAQHENILALGIGATNFSAPGSVHVTGITKSLLSSHSRSPSFLP